MNELNEWARIEGAYHPDRAWLLHDRDVWVANPHYKGPAAAHPEDQYEDYGPPPGSWADVARIMAANDDSGFDWDAWKDEQKEG